MITYQTFTNSADVYLDYKYTGTIKKDSEGWRFHPMGNKRGGEPFLTLTQCKQSLEANESNAITQHRTR